MDRMWKIQRIAAAAAVLLLGITGTAATFASVTAVSNSVVNSFVAGEVKTTIEEETEGIIEKNQVIKKNPAVHNEGKSNAFVRARVTKSPADDSLIELLYGSFTNGTFQSGGKALNVLDHGMYDPDGNGIGWYKVDDGWYYYSTPIAPGESTETLFDAVKIGDVSGDFDITVYQESVFSGSYEAGETVPLEEIRSFFDAVDGR